tara:strand:+ start:106 stop:408 length:303 start_codon:yes stop_codon:yes gene_type:complete
MSDTITKWHEMEEERKLNENAEQYQKELRESLRKDISKYIFLLDFNDGKVYRYDISSLCDEKNAWNPDSETCEAFLYGAGHRVNDCEWMVTTSKNIEYGN